MLDVSELMDLYLLLEVNKIVHVNDHGRYWDDGLMVLLDKRREKW